MTPVDAAFVRGGSVAAQAYLLYVPTGYLQLAIIQAYWREKTVAVGSYIKNNIGIVQ